MPGYEGLPQVSCRYPPVSRVFCDNTRKPLYLSYIPYGTAKGMSVSEGMSGSEIYEMVWDNQKFMFSYHGNLVAEHPYSSPGGRGTDLRPILYYLQTWGGYKSSLLPSNPVVWWTGIGAVISLIIAL